MARYVIAVLSVGLALFVRLVVAPSVFETATFMPFFFAIAATAALGGMRPGLVATALSVVASEFVLLPPAYSFWIDSPTQRTQLLLFSFIAGCICWLSGALHDARRRSEARLVESQQLEEQLRESEQRLRLAQHAAQIGTFDWNLQTGVNVWTSELEALYGLPPGGFAKTQPAWESLVHPDDRTMAKRKVDEAFQTAKPVEGEWRVIWPDGSLHWLAGRWQVIQDETGQPVRMIGVNVDMTDRKQAEESLRDSRELFRTLAQSAPVGIFRTDAAGRCIYVNEWWTQISGLSLEESLGDGWTRALHPEDRQRVTTAWMHAARDGRPFEAEYRFLSKCGAESCVIGRAVAERDAEGKVTGFVGTTTDITARKEAEEQLARELEAMTILQKLSMLFVQEGRLEPVLSKVLDAAIAIAGADYGNIQLLDPESGNLRIAVQRGFETWWLDFWNAVSAGRGTCGTALERGERVIVEDVEQSEIFIGTPALDIQLRAGVRAVQSMPLVSRAGKQIGMLSTHHRAPHRPDDRVLRLLDLLGSQAADIIEHTQTEEALQASERRIQQALQVSRSFTFEWEPQTDRVRRSASCQSILQLADDEAVNDTSERYFQRVHSEDRQRFTALVSGLTPDSPSYSVEYRIECGDGGLATLEEMGQGTFDSTGRLTRLVGVATDITARKQAEDALREREATLQGFYESAPFMMGIAELHGDRTVAVSGNTTVAAFFGTSPDQLPGQTGPELGNPLEFEQLWVKNYLRCQREALPVHFDYRHGDHWLSAAVAYLGTGPTGHPRFSFVVDDITERKQAEERLRTNEERLAGIVDSAMDAIISLDEEQCVVLFNAAAQKMFGIPAEAARGEPVTRFIPERFRDQHAAHVRAFGETGVTSRAMGQLGEVWGLRTSGEEFPIEASISQVVAAGRKLYTVILRDISERKEVEEALQQSKADLVRELERMASLQAVSTRMAQTGELNVLLQEILAAAAELTGTDKGNIQLLDPESGHLRIVVHQGLGQRLVEHFASQGWSVSCDEALRRGQRVIIEDVANEPSVQDTLGLEIVLEDGIRAIQCTPLVTRDGRLLGMLNNHFRQVHRPSESDMRYLDLLARMAADLIERAQADRALREADQKKDEFLSVLAHELRNPLAPIRNGLQLMLLAKNNPQVVKDARSMIERQVSQMVRLIDDLMDLTRISQGKVVLKKSRVPVMAVVSSAMETSRPLFEASNHELVLDIPNEPILLDADETRLSQVLANLLNNAAKYTERGGQIHLAVRQENHEVVICVRDTGIGIPSPMLPRVFDMFTQVDRSLEKAQGGLGIGLNIVKRLVEMHGGTIVAESKGVGMGSQFTVRLPLGQVEPNVDVKVAEGQATAVSSDRRILVVDDNQDAAMSLAMMLQMLGHETQVAHDGLQAIDVGRTFHPDTILMDVGMPRLNGYDACRRIREEPWGRDILIVACTGWGQDHDRQKSQAAGFDRHLVKPMSFDQLQELLSESAVSDKKRFKTVGTTLA